MNTLKFSETRLPGLFEVIGPVHRDQRGEFTRVYCEKDLRGIRPGLRFTQVNMSLNPRPGTLRGLHFQHAPAAEAKLVRCISGRVFDVAVDLRPDSPTFLDWHAAELSEDSPLALFIPEGFAHGFLTLSDNSRLLYLHTGYWTPELAGTVRYDDPTLAIAWPMEPQCISDADLGAPLITPDFAGART